MSHFSKFTSFINNIITLHIINSLNKRDENQIINTIDLLSKDLYLTITIMV